MIESVNDTNNLEWEHESERFTFKIGNYFREIGLGWNARFYPKDSFMLFEIEIYVMTIAIQVDVFRL